MCIYPKFHFQRNVGIYINKGETSLLFVITQRGVVIS